MTRRKSLKKGYWDQKRCISLQGSESTGLMMAVKCYLLVLILMVMSETCMWRRWERGRRKGSEKGRVCLYCAFILLFFFLMFFNTWEVPLLVFSKFVVQVNLSSAKRGRNQGGFTKHTEACIFCFAFKWFRIMWITGLLYVGISELSVKCMWLKKPLEFSGALDSGNILWSVTV